MTITDRNGRVLIEDKDFIDENPCEIFIFIGSKKQRFLKDNSYPNDPNA